jgi:SRSO17 transposase
MTRRYPVSTAPGPLEDYAHSFDDLFRARSQRHSFRRYLEGLLLPAERNKTLTALANTEPRVGAQRREAQSLQWFLSESGWDSDEINERRLELLFEEPATAPSEKSVLIIDEHGDRKWGKHTAHVGRQWLAYPSARQKAGWSV